MRVWPWIVIGALAACGDDDARAVQDPNLDASVNIRCTSDPDAATALGVRGVDLWNAYVGLNTLQFNRPAKKGFQTATFTIGIAPTERQSLGLDDCSQVAVPVLVSVFSEELKVNETVLATLRGSLISADIGFATPEYLLGFEPHLYGNIVFQQGQATQIRVRTDSNGYWYTPLLQEAP